MTGLTFRDERATENHRGYISVYLDGQRIAWLGQVRRGLWVCVSTKPKAGSPRSDSVLQPKEGPLSILKAWVVEHAQDLAHGEPVTA
jgi:hypothetical protein